MTTKTPDEWLDDIIKGKKPEEAFWKSIDLQIDDEIKAHAEYRRLAREGERLGISGWTLLGTIAMDESRHREMLEAIKKRRQV